MSRIPGSSPITPDIEDVRRSDDDAFGDEGGDGTPEPREEDEAPAADEEDDAIDALAADSVEGRLAPRAAARPDAARA